MRLLYASSTIVSHSCSPLSFHKGSQGIKEYLARFQIEVTTLAELAGNKNQRRIDELRSLYDRRSMMVGNRGLPPAVSLGSKVTERIPEEIDQSEADPNNASDSTNVDGLIEETDDPST